MKQHRMDGGTVDDHEMFRNIVEISPDIVFRTNRRGVFTYVSPAAEESLGYEPDELVGTSFETYTHDDDFEEATGAFGRVLEGETVRGVEVRFRRKEGAYAHIEVNAVPVTEGGDIVEIQGITRDITGQKEREGELRRQNQRLEEFASMVSHDLRGPLNVATGRIELARETGDIDHLDGAEEALGRMDALIEQVLELARKGRTVGEGEMTDLGEVAEDAWDSTDTGDATLKLGEVEAVEADGVRLREVFENLFRNSVKHGSTGGPTGSDDSVEHGGPVTVSVGALDDGFYVEDDGTGMPEDERDDVFEYGYSTTEGGSGIGLAVVKSVVEAHGWEIDVTESVDGGARFEITGI